MTKKRAGRTGRRGGRARAGSRAVEWVGGRLSCPFYITKGEPHRPEVLLWLELPGGLVVGSRLIDRKAAPVSLGDALLEAMSSPLAGPSRRTARVRVAHAALAAEVRGAVPRMEVRVAPTPELDRVLRLMAESFFEEDEEEDSSSYLEQGRVTVQAVERLFGSVRSLFQAAPWELADDRHLLRLDIPQLGVSGACVSIIGALGESLGLVIFPSRAACERFLQGAEMEDIADEPVDLGTTVLSVTFEHGADLPASMRREVAEHGWPLAGPEAYPSVQHRDPDGVPRPLSERDIRIASACAASVATFFSRHRELFGPEPSSVAQESFFDESGLEVRLTLPYEEGRPGTAPDPRPQAPPAPSPSPRAESQVRRNQPCPCGSGKKYKKCCLEKDRAAGGVKNAATAVNEIDVRMFREMMRFGVQRFGKEWLLRAEKDFAGPEASMQLLGPWVMYHMLEEGRPLVQWFVEEQGRRLSASELSWLRAQQQAWLSLWEVLGVEPGSSITLGDLLTGEERTVLEISGSRTVARRDVLLGRVVDHEGISLLCGIHPRPLPPAEAAAVVEQVRRRLRRRRDVPAIRLRDEKIGRHMIACWEQAAARLDLRRSHPPRLQNTDGEELLLTADWFEMEPGAREAIEQRLAALEGVEPPEPDDEEPTYVFIRSGNAMHRGWENTVIGRAVFSAGKLRLETNSVQRADALRERIEAACSGLIRHVTREHSDPVALMQKGKSYPKGDLKPAKMPPGEADRLILELKQKHYAEWPDHPLPALGGKTPRQAVRSKAGRGQVDLLLKECENHEARMLEKQRFDFSVLRRELGL